MNTIGTIHTEYLGPSRTIETILVSDEKVRTAFFAYNYAGNSYRVFKDHLDLIQFFQDKTEADIHFCTETELDDFLINVELSA